MLELLVVLAVIFMLMSLLLPALQKAKDSGRSILCLSNQKQCAIAQISYMGDHQGYGIIYSGWNDWSWSDYLYKTAYLNTKNCFVCPSWVPFKYTSKYNTYGMLMWGAPFPAFFISADTSIGNYILASSKVQFPSDYFLLLDSLALPDNPDSVMYRLQTRSIYLAIGSDRRRIHIRHNKNANIVFLDGHASSCGEDAIIRSAIKTNGNSTSVNVIDKNLIEKQIYP